MGRWVYRRPFFRAFKPKIQLFRPGAHLPVRRRRHFRVRRQVVHGKVAAAVAALTFTAQQAAAGHVIPLRRRLNFKVPRPAQAHAKIPLNPPQAGHVFVGRRQIRLRLPRPIAAHVKIILKRAQAGGAIVLRRAVRIRPNRPQQAHAKIILKRAQVGHAVVIRRRVNFKPPRPGAARGKIILPRQQQAGHAIVRALRRIQRPQHVRPTKRAQPPGGRFEGKQGPLKRLLKAVSRMRQAAQRRLLFRPREIPPIIVQPVVHAIPRGEIQAAGAVAGTVYSGGAVRGEVADNW